MSTERRSIWPCRKSICSSSCRSSTRWVASTRPSKASRRAGSFLRKRPRANSARDSASLTPASIASIMLRPLLPSTSLATEDSLMLAVSSTFCTRVMAWALCRTRVLRARTRSRRSRMALGGMKLALSRPWRKRSAIHSLSLISVL